MGSSLKGSVALHLILITVLGLLVYSNTFHVPFQWDDKYDYLSENPLIEDLSYFLEPSRAKELKQYSSFKTRYIGYLTFALNYKIHGLDVTGYHIVNLSIHILNALLVYFLVILTFRAPFLDSSSLKKHSKYIALFTGLLFVSHPVQTEAVTYIFQRLASLMTFFYLLSLVAYIGSRLSKRKSARYAFYTLSLISAVLAMKTKENAFTLPLVIALYEFFFLSGPIKRRVLGLIPLFLTLFIIPLTLIGIDKPLGEIIGSIGPDTRGYFAISREDYLLTQFRVIITYIRLLFLPINQNIDYDYPVFHSFWNPQVFLSFLFLLPILGFAVYLFYCSRFSNSVLRFSAFGIFWFFITLSVESSIIPIPMAINEYRVYLPSAGAFSAIVSGLFFLLNGFGNKKIKTAAVFSFVSILLVFSYATYARNNVWRSEISLWEDVVSKSPGKARGHINLGTAYGSKGLLDETIEHYHAALKLEPDNPVARNNLGNAYFNKGLVDKAVEQYKIALGLKPDYADAHYSLGIAYVSEGLIDKAVEHFQTAVRINPDNAEAHNNLGNAYKVTGLIDRAIEHYKTAIRLKPDYADAHYNLGIVSASRGLVNKAIEHYKAALRLKPDNTDTHNNLALAYMSAGLVDKAIEHYKAALRLKPDYAKTHFNLGLAYLEKGSMEKARREFETALKITPDYHKARQYLNKINF